MSRKDYEAVAAVLKERLGFAQETGDRASAFLVTDIAVDLANVFQAENPRFDHAKFMLAVVSS
jgi:hypothetical protein